MFRPTGFAELEGRRVGLWGFGLEGRAALARLAGHGSVVVVDDDPSGDARVLATADGGLDALGECDVVLKSPGIPRRRADVLALEARDVTVTSALNLWLHETDRARVIAVTGTKGKSTTTSLITFMLRALGERAQSLGNIGRPPYDPSVKLEGGWAVLEVSSYQCVDLEVAPAFVVVTSLGSDHLDWHGSLTQYHEDKLSLTRAAGEHRTFVHDGPALRAVAPRLGGDVHFVGPDASSLGDDLGLLGEHGRANVALALAVVAVALDRDVAEVAAAAEHSKDDFTPLPGRLTLVATETTPRGIRRYVDDGLATAVLPTRAALDVFREEAVALIAGGFDRGVDYDELVDALVERDAPFSVALLGPVGVRLAKLFDERGLDVRTKLVDSMNEAVAFARSSLPDGGVVLFSPAAPSFDAYDNWEARSRDFTACVRAVLERP